MRYILVVVFAGIVVLIGSCEHGHHAERKSDQLAADSFKGDSLDSLSLEIVKYLRMHDLNNFIGGPASAFRDSIPFSTTWPSVGWEDSWVNTIYYDYEGTDLNVTITVMDAPYRFNLDTLKMLNQEPQKMFEYNISSICVGVHNKCLVEAR